MLVVDEVRAAEVYRFELRGRRGGALRLLRSLLLSVVLASGGVAGYELHVIDRRSGQRVGSMDAGDDHYVAAGLLDLVAAAAEALTPEQFARRYDLAPGGSAGA